MAKYGSGDQLNLKVGVSSFSEEKTSLVVIGKVGVGTDDAMRELHVEGDAYISGNIGIGTSVAVEAPTGVGSTAVLAVGIVTANEIYGTLSGNTGVVTTAQDIAGISTGQLLFQNGLNDTQFLEYGSTGQALISRGENQSPNWENTAPAGAIEGIILRDEGNPVGMGTTFGILDFRGAGIAVTGHSGFNIATITVAPNFGDELITGAAISIGQTATFGGIVGSALTITGISSFTGNVFIGGTVGPAPGMALTYYGDGSNLAGAGVWQKNSAGIHTVGNFSNVGIGTTTPLTALQVGAAPTSFNVISAGGTVQVGIGTTTTNYTLEVLGDTNIEGDLKIEGNKVGTIAMIVALGGF